MLYGYRTLLCPALDCGNVYGIAPYCKGTYGCGGYTLGCGGYTGVFSDSNSTPGYTTLLCPARDSGNLDTFSSHIWPNNYQNELSFSGYSASKCNTLFTTNPLPPHPVKKLNRITFCLEQTKQKQIKFL